VAKPSLTTLVRQQITDGYVVDVARGPRGSFTVATAIDSPADIEPGRYVMIPAQDAALAVKRLITVEQANALDRAARRQRHGTQTLKRSK
jgi:hypothetical protein